MHGAHDAISQQRHGSNDYMQWLSGQVLVSPGSTVAIDGGGQSHPSPHCACSPRMSGFAYFYTRRQRACRKEVNGYK